MGGLNITSTMRMGFEKNLVLMQLDLQNSGNESLTPQLSVDMSSFWRYGPGTWNWSTPRPPDDPSNFTVSFPNRSTILTTDKLTSASSAFSVSYPLDRIETNNSRNSGFLSPRVGPGSSVSMIMAVAVGNQSHSSTLQEAHRAIQNFSALWEESMIQWSQRYQTVFEPNNTFFSGSLPVLVTEDQQISKLWYQSVISILFTLRTNLLYPRVYATIGPDDGTTIVYAWDTSLWSSIMVLLDPEFLKTQVSIFLKYGANNGYAVDYLSETIVGANYSANDLGLFTMMIKYVNMTGDYDWLHLPAANTSTNLAQLGARATHWKALENSEFGLADYGGLSNLLEEVITYINMVPSLNAANVWMMNQYSYLLHALNDTSSARNYSQMADSLASTVLSLYAGPGTGYWLTQYPNNTRQAVKHVYDFDTISLYFTPYLNASIKTDMLSYLHSDLYTGSWLRALSASDLTANISMRPDHGSNGAYASWPALAAAGASQLGDYPAMMTYLRSFASVLSEGTWAQCYQLIDPLGPAAASAAEGAAHWAQGIVDLSGDYFGGANGTAPAGLEGRARISLPDQGESYNENNGASFADVVLSYVFGWNPDGKTGGVRDAGVARGDFVGRLVGVRGPGGRYYGIDVGPNGVDTMEMQM